MSMIITPREFNQEQRKIGSATQRQERRARYLYEHKQQGFREHQRLKHPGRPIMNPHGGWVTDKAERTKGLLLCRKCSPKFDPKAYQYYRTREFMVHGPCDACKQYAPINSATFFIHESFLGNNHGQCWTPQ